MYFSVILLYIVVFWRATSLLALGYYVLPSFINKGFIIIIITMLATWLIISFNVWHPVGLPEGQFFYVITLDQHTDDSQADKGN